MKEISVADKTELSQLQKQFKEISNQLTEISEDRDKLENDLQVKFRFDFKFNSASFAT